MNYEIVIATRNRQEVVTLSLPSFINEDLPIKLSTTSIAEVSVEYSEIKIMPIHCRVGPWSRPPVLSLSKWQYSNRLHLTRGLDQSPLLPKNRSEFRRTSPKGNQAILRFSYDKTVLHPVQWGSRDRVNGFRSTRLPLKERPSILTIAKHESSQAYSAAKEKRSALFLR